MPVKMFWVLERNITRLQAEHDLRAMNVMAGVNSGKGAGELQSRLLEELGTVVRVTPKLDRVGLRRLASYKQGLKANGS